MLSKCNQQWSRVFVVSVINQTNAFFPVKELTKETEKKTSLENDTSLFHWNITESDRTVCVFNFQVYRCVPCIRFY